MLALDRRDLGDKLRAPPSVWRARGFSLGLQGARSAFPGPSLGAGSPEPESPAPPAGGALGLRGSAFGLQFSSVQLLSHVQLFATPRPSARQASLSIKFTSIESVMPSNHLILCRPLLLPPSIFPRISASKLCF